MTIWGEAERMRDNCIQKTWRSDPNHYHLPILQEGQLRLEADSKWIYEHASVFPHLHQGSHHPEAATAGKGKLIEQPKPQPSQESIC